MSSTPPAGRRPSASAPSPADPFGARRSLGPGLPDVYGLDALAGRTAVDVGRLPLTVRILLENLLRHAGEGIVRADDVVTLAAWRPTSGALGADALAPAMSAGTQVGAFHPLVSFADTERAVAALKGAAIAIEGDDQLAALLAEMAEAIGAQPVRLAPGSKAAYHAAAVLAAGGLVALLDAIAELGRVAGLDEAGSLAIYGPLIEGTLGNARALGIRAALTGPITRGDRGTLEAHLATLRRHAPGVVDLYRAAAEREIALAEARGALTPEAARQLRTSLATGT